MITDLSELSIKKLKFKKTKDCIGAITKNYSITNFKNEKIKILLKNINIPFGYEDYNGKKVLNIEINPKKYNEHNNIKSFISAFESEFADINNFHGSDLKTDLTGKGYYNNMRDSKQGSIIRCLIFSQPEIYANIGKFKTLMTSKDIEKTISNIEIELGTLWITENNYGVSWYVKKIEILYGS
jgi:hypothetical protein